MAHLTKVIGFAAVMGGRDFLHAQALLYPRFLWAGLWITGQIVGGEGILGCAAKLGGMKKPAEAGLVCD